MFLTELELQEMTGVIRGTHRPSTLRRHLVGLGLRENIDFFKRHDNWYSVIRPSVPENQTHRPKLRIPA